jgi:hypothetical protein
MITIGEPTMSTTTMLSARHAARSLQPRLAAFAGFLAAAAFAASAVLQLTDLNWVINKVQTVPQHVDMALFSVAIAATMPALGWLGRQLGKYGRMAAGAIILGQLIICAITTQSNIRGVDAAWFNAAAAVANVLWLPPLIVLAVLAYRRTVLPRPLAIGLVIAYAGTIPLAVHGGGLLAAAYWAMVAVHLAKEDS